MQAQVGAAARRVTVAAVALGLVGFGLATVGARAAAPGCAGRSTGGDWRTYSHDLSNSRNQDQETSLGPAAAAKLAPAWIFSATAHGGAGQFNNDPIVADGCLFLASDGGSVFKLNADTGSVVWQTQLPDPVDGSPAVADGLVFLDVNKGSAPYTVALDESDGHVVWKTTIDTQPGSDTFASPIVFRGMVFAGISGSGAEAGTTATGNPGIRLQFRGSWVLLDAATGALLHKGYVIPDADFQAGYAGGGVWATAAVDLNAQDAYVGTGNPFSARQHPNTEAILKIDVNRDDPNFGEIVGVYQGTPDLYVQGGTSKPVCALYTDVFTCDPPDFDFGGSPQLFSLPGGTAVVGEHQKSGDYHVADRATMHGVWKTTVGGPFGQFGGEATASYDGQRIYVAGNAPGLLSALDPATGGRDWVTPIADGLHFQSVTTADGVAYATDTRGLLDIWDASSGVPLAVRSLGVDSGQGVANGFSTGWGVVVARHTVYVPTSGGYLIAYR